MSALRRRREADDGDQDDFGHPRSRQRVRRDDSDQEARYNSDDGINESSLAEPSLDQDLAKKLVRYALSCEFSRTPIRRDGIKERVLGNRGRSFRRVFALAQTQLRHVWGMQLQELPVREKMSLQERRQAMRSNHQPKLGSGAYVLTSTLPDEYRSASIISPSRAPSADEEATYVAFYTLVVSLIWLNGGELGEQKLKRYLLRLNADQNVSTEKTESTLRKMERHGYVIKKVDRPPLGQDGDHTITWHVGPRARVEIGVDGVMGMVGEVYGGSDEHLEKKLKASLGIRDRQPPAANTNGAGVGESQ